jgi:hypothetical protein
MTETLLVIHILAAGAWIGGGLLNGYVGPKMAAAGGPVAIQWLKVGIKAGARFFIPAGLLTGISGVTLVLVDDAYDWSDGFVGIGLAIVTIALGLALWVLLPAARGALAAAESGDFPAVAPKARRAALTGRVTVILLILAEIAMVLRLGA